MVGFFTPNPRKNFVDNYGEHLEAVNVRTSQAEHDFWETESAYDRLVFIRRELAAHIHCSEVLYDGYDYADVLMGTTAVPLFSALDAVVASVFATWHGLNSLAVMAGCADDDEGKHADNALGYLMIAAGLLVFTLVGLVDSLISLLSRPLLTAIYGSKPQDCPRFHGYRETDHDDDSFDDDPSLADAPTL